MKRSKYRNVRTGYNGVAYASRAEAVYAAELDLLVKAGEVRFWLGQPTFRLGCPENIYRPDFLVVRRAQGSNAQCVKCGEPFHTYRPPNPASYAVDVKGVETAKFRRDKKLWAKYGPCPLYVVSRRGTEVVEGLA